MINFLVIICKLRQYLDMIFWNLAQSPINITLKPLTRSITLNTKLHCLGKGFHHYGFLKIGSLLPKNKNCWDYPMVIFIVFDWHMEEVH